LRNQDRVLLRSRANGTRLAHEDLEQPLDYVHDVRLALPEVWILDRVELLDQHTELLRQRPFRIAQLLGDRALRHFVQGGIGQDHPVHVEEGAEFGRRIARSHRAVQGLQLFLDGVQRMGQALDFPGYLLGRDGIMRDLERRVRNELCPADRDASGDADAVQHEAHCRGSVSTSGTQEARAQSPTRRLQAPRGISFLTSCLLRFSAVFAELPCDKLHHRRHRLRFVRAARFDPDRRAHARCEQHHCHDATGTRAPSIPYQ
jgi:hypothetical protein